ncbi:transposase, partial [Klebsiella pneumoniae]|nr:transposase [Klebsiella pneumoniae]
WEITERWLTESNSEQPHESLNNQTTEEFIRSLQKGPDL